MRRQWVFLLLLFLFFRLSTDEANHGGATTAVVGVHAEANDAGGRTVLETERSLAA